MTNSDPFICNNKTCQCLTHSISRQHTQFLYIQKFCRSSCKRKFLPPTTDSEKNQFAWILFFFFFFNSETNQVLTYKRNIPSRHYTGFPCGYDPTKPPCWLYVVSKHGIWRVNQAAYFWSHPPCLKRTRSRRVGTMMVEGGGGRTI